MKHLLLSTLALLSFYFSPAQSNYFKHFINNKIEDVKITTTILDTCRLLNLSDYDCGRKEILNIEKITEPRLINYQNGKVIKEQNYSQNGSIVSLITNNKISTSDDDQEFAVIKKQVDFPLTEDFVNIFKYSPSVYSSTPYYDTVFIKKKNNQIEKEWQYNIPTFYIYDGNMKLKHKLTLGKIPLNHAISDQTIAQIIKLTDQHLPYKENGKYTRKSTPLGGILGELMIDGKEIYIAQRVDFNYNNNGDIRKKTTLNPPFASVKEYEYDKDRRLSALTTSSFGEVGARTSTERYQYDKDGYRWPASLNLIYNKNKLVEVERLWVETYNIEEPVLDEDGIHKKDKNGEYLYKDSEYKVNHEETLHQFEYDRKGRVKKEIVPGKIEYTFTYIQ